MPEMVLIRVNGKPVGVRADATLAAALLGSGFAALRKSVTGASRGPLCGMGICFECRVTVDGIPHVKSCQTMCRAGMDVELDA